MIKKWQARTKQELIIEVWEDLDCESVGKLEIERILQQVAATFGERAIESPAAIARKLADEGAVLRHPEILNFDSQWREGRLQSQPEISFVSLPDAVDSLKRLEEWRRELIAGEVQSKEPQELALDFKRQAQLEARSKILSEEQRNVANEVVQWLTIWLQEPEIFDEWLSLRQRSPAFIKKFGVSDEL
jgi:hypothetical protein